MNQNIDVLLSFEKSAGENVQIEKLTIAVGEAIPCCAYPEERLYYVETGFGAVSVYDEIENGDVYVLRPNVTAYFTPGLRHTIVNTGSMPMVLVLIRTTGGLVPDGAAEGVQVWTNIETSKAVGTGFWYTDIFNLHENETAREGQHLQVWGMTFRRAQKMASGEVLQLGSGRSTRWHAHSETNECFYILSGEGNFVLDGEKIPCKAGSVCSIGLGIVHSVENTGSAPLLYICINTFA